MEKNVKLVIFVLLMAALIVAADFLFFRHRFWVRLIVNAGIVLVFIALYLIFIRRP